MKTTAKSSVPGQLTLQLVLQYWTVACLCLGGGLFASAHAIAETAVTRITEVELLLSDEASLPTEQAAWQLDTLPYRLVVDTAETRFAWFRFALPASNEGGPIALYLSNYMYSVDVYLNEVRIGGTSQPPGTLAMGWTRPLLVSLPERLLQTEPAIVHIRLTQAAFTNVLPVILVGPEAELLPTWQNKLLSQSQGALVALVLCVLMGAFTLGLWIQRPRDQEFAWFAGACLCLALPMFYLSISYAVISHTVLLMGAIGGLILGVGCFLLFLGKILQLQEPLWSKTVAAVVVISALVLPLLPVAHVPKLLLLVYLTWFGSLAIILRQALVQMKQKLAAAYWVVLSIALLGVIGVHDFYVFITRDFTVLNRSGLYLQYAIPVMLILYFAQLVQRYIAALHDSELLGEQLEQRVAAVSAELEASHRTRRKLELEEAAEQQREKIYQDLHDDVGARLLAIVHAEESRKQSTMAQSALSSLRDTVSTSYVEALPLPELVVMMADELGIRCRTQDIDFELLLPKPLPGLIWNSESAHHIWRILQEVVNNSIRHAQAGKVVLLVEQHGDVLACRVEDDGAGFDNRLPPGSGMRNIQYRANQLKANVRWYALDDGGTGFALQVPLS